jgi:hypothetical protein
LFSNTLSLCSSHKEGDHISCPYKATGKILVLYMLWYKFWERRWEDKYSELNGSKHSPNLICS